MKPKPWGCAHYSAVALLCFAMFLYVAWFFLFQSVPLRISPDTTYITEPLDATGKWVDYFRAMELKNDSPEMQTDDNGVRILIRALGIMEKVQLEIAKAYYEKLGLDPTVAPTHLFLEPDAYLQRVRTHLPHLYEEQKRKMYDKYVKEWPEPKDYTTWQPVLDHSAFQFLGVAWIQENPIMEHWLHDCSPALDAIAEAVRKPVFAFPRVRLHDDVLFVMTARTYARGLRFRANYRIAQGDFDGAFDDIITIYCLGRRHRHAGTTFEAVVGSTIEDVAGGIDFHFPGDRQPTFEQLERLLNEIDNLPPRVKFETLFEMERLFGLSTVQSVLRNISEGQFDAADLFDSGGFAPRLLAVVGVDWNIVFKRLNQAYDEFDAGTFDYFSDYDYNDKFWSRPHRVLTLNSRSELVADYIISLFHTGFDAIKRAWWRTECLFNMKRLALAMLIYEKEHGALPPTFTTSAEGKPLHSWRVLLLPYLGEEAKELYESLRLDEPWDSEHNKQYHQTSLAVFQCPGANNARMVDGGTHYSVIVGSEALFGTDGRGRLSDDYRRNMLLIVERRNAICWMMPDDEIPQIAAERGVNETFAVGSFHAGGVNMATKAGGVRYFSERTDNDKLREWIVGTDNSGEW